MTDTSTLPADDFRRVNPRFADEALAWLLAKHGNVVPIPGTKRRAYLAENAAAAAIRLTAEQVSSLDALFAPEAVAGARYNEAGMKDIGL